MMRYLSVFVFILYAIPMVGQTTLKPVFPLKGNTQVTSGFGEMRPNHFHSGIDFGTNGKNLPVLAVDNGYISRIKVSPGGYGNAIYVSHPSGYTSVYAHLDSFNPEVEIEVFNQQRLNRSFSIDYFPDSSRFRVKQSEQIAISGNSGSSTGPHLHFEIRDSKTEEALNPFLHGISVKDITPPVIQAVYAFPLPGKGEINGLGKLGRLPELTTLPGQLRSFKSGLPSPICSGWISFGIQGGDVIGKPTSSTAIYSIEVFVDDKRIFSSSFNRFSFDDNKAVNAWMHYPTYKTAKTKIQQFAVPAFAEPTGIYKEHSNKGYFFFNEDKMYDLRIACTDFSGNQTIFNGKVKGKPYVAKKIVSNTNLPLFVPGKEKIIRQSGVEVYFPANALFDTTEISLRTLSGNSLGPQIQIGKPEIPVYHPFRLNIKPNDIMLKKAEKLYISQKSAGNTTHIKTKWNGETLEANVTSFGEFELKLDTIPPSINIILSAAQKQKGANANIVPFEATLQFTIRDAETGIQQMNAFLDDEWLLLKPVKQGPTYKLALPSNISTGNHQLKISVIDYHGNTVHKTFTLRK